MVGVKALREQGHKGPITSDEASEAAEEKRRREVNAARRQTDPASKEFVKRGRPKKGVSFGNTKQFKVEANSAPQIRRTLARSYPDLLARVESGELSANAAVDAGRNAAATMAKAPDDVGPGQGFRTDIATRMEIESARNTEAPMVGVKGGGGEHRNNVTKLGRENG